MITHTCRGFTRNHSQMGNAAQFVTLNFSVSMTAPLLRIFLCKHGWYVMSSSNIETKIICMRKYKSYQSKRKYVPAWRVTVFIVR